MLKNAFEELAPIPPDAEEVSVGKFRDDPDNPKRFVQFSLGYEHERIIGFVGHSIDGGDTYDHFYKRSQERNTWEDMGTGNPVDNTAPLNILAQAGFAHGSLSNNASLLLLELSKLDHPSDRDIFDAASVALAPSSHNVRHLLRYDYTDLRTSGVDDSQLDLSIYKIIDDGEELVQARLVSYINRDEVPCQLEVLFNNDEYDRPYVEIHITGDGIDERIIPKNFESTLHELMSQLCSLVKEKREPYLETNRFVV